MNARRLAGLLLVGMVVAPTTLGARRLAVAIRADAIDLQLTERIEDGLPAGWPKMVASPIFNENGIKVFESEDLDGPEADALFTVATALRAPGTAVRGVLAAGESYTPRSVDAAIYAGWLRVTLNQPSDETKVIAIAQRYNLTFEGPINGGRHMRLNVPMDSATVTQVVDEFVAPLGPTRPVMHKFGGPELTPREIGGYHLYPPAKNKLAVVLHDHVADPKAQLELILSMTIDDDAAPSDEVQIVEFSGTGPMMAAMGVLMTSHRDTVKRVGPAVSEDPPQFLSADLAVNFIDQQSKDAAEPILEFYSLDPQTPRRIPYLDHGYMYTRRVRGLPQPSFALYDAAADLLDAKLATFAAPDLFALNVPMSGGTGCVPAANQQYLNDIRVVEAWEVVGEKAGSTTIGFLDEGFISDDSDDGLCENVDVVIMMDTRKCEEAECAEYPWYCIPSDPRNWCYEGEDEEECPGGLRQQGSNNHTDALAMVTAAIHHPVADETTTCDVRGIVDGAPLVNAGRDSVSTSDEIASAAWWMSGGDPLNEDYYPTDTLLEDENRSRVLNFSFARTYAADDCPATPGTFCAKICIDGDDCSLIDHALNRLRNGLGDGIRSEGHLVVVAVPHKGTPSDFHLSPYTTAIATVRYNGNSEPHYEDGEFYITRTPNVDLVAPMGGNEPPPFDVYYLNAFSDLTDPIPVPTGNTSAATAVVSGVAALMYDVNPALTAAQVDCILKETAQKSPGGDWGDGTSLNYTETVGGVTSTVGCDFRDDPLHSLCFGYGMVDAQAAVLNAAWCAPEIEAVMYVDDLEYIAGEVVIIEIDVDGHFEEITVAVMVPYSADIPLCMCDEAGERLDFEIEETSGSISFEGLDREMGQRLEDLKVEQVVALLRCIESGTCECPPRDPRCVTLDLTNRLDKGLPEIEAALCRGEECIDLRPDRDEWPAGGKIRLAVPQTEEFVEFLEQGRLKGDLTLRVRSGEEPVAWRRRLPARPDGPPDRPTMQRGSDGPPDREKKKQRGHRRPPKSRKPVPGRPAEPN